MTSNVVSSPGPRSAPRAVAASGAVVYDTFGMPMSVLAAKAMSTGQIESALRRALAGLRHESAASIDATALMDSIEVVFLVGRYYRELNRKQLDLSKIDREHWSTLEGIADVLHTTTGAMK